MKLDTIPALYFLFKLALETEFPASREDILVNAVQIGIDHHVDEFIKLFDREVVFENSTDFLERCEELEENSTDP